MGFLELMIQGTKLYKFIISDENIIRAIYALESSVFEPKLLSQTDLAVFYCLQDKLGHRLIRNTRRTKSRIEYVLVYVQVNGGLFSLKVILNQRNWIPKQDDT